MGRTTIQSGKSLGDHLIQLLWLMGKLRPIEKDWLMVTQDIQDRLLIIPSAPYIAVASFGPGKGLNVVGDPAPVRRRTEKGQEEGLGDSIQGVTELPLF